jgi:hypothetical protein
MSKALLVFVNLCTTQRSLLVLLMMVLLVLPLLVLPLLVLLLCEMFVLIFLVVCSFFFDLFLVVNQHRFTLKVLKNAFKKSCYYLFLFAVPILGYSLCGFIAFGSRIREFHTFIASVETVTTMAFGTFNNDILLKYPRFGGCFMFSFYLVVVFLMRTLFTAIVM